MTREAFKSSGTSLPIHWNWSSSNLVFALFACTSLVSSQCACRLVIIIFTGIFSTSWHGQTGKNNKQDASVSGEYFTLLQKTKRKTNTFIIVIFHLRVSLRDKWCQLAGEIVNKHHKTTAQYAWLQDSASVVVAAAVAVDATVVSTIYRTLACRYRRLSLVHSATSSSSSSSGGGSGGTCY